MQMAYGVRQGHVEGFRSKKRRTFRAQLIMFRSFFRNQKECRNNSSQNHLYISQKELPYTTRGLPQKVKIQTPIEMKVFGCLLFEGAITSIVNWRVFTETLGKRNLHITGE
tara:strand:- start:215 stop:547 length:333 start_codon:yes stop_codon:yes gene_type:complete